MTRSETSFSATDPRRWPLPVSAGLALVAFAANSLLARAALDGGSIDVASFTTLRLVSGAAVLALILAVTARDAAPRLAEVDWRAAAALFGYASCFSFGYLTLDAGIGALILFGSVQASMIGAALVGGERTRFAGWVGIGVGLLGVGLLLAPGAAAPDAFGAALMVVSGVCWAVYSLIGRGARDPVRATTLNFLAAVPLSLALSAVFLSSASIDARGAALAMASGAAASGCGYVIWYAALTRLSATRAAVLQLGTPLLAAIAGVLLLGEAVTLRLILGGALILGGVALYLRQKG